MRRSVLSLLALTPLLWSPLPGAEPDPVVDLLQVARDQDPTWQRRRADLILDLTHQDSERRIAALRGIGDLQDPALAGHLLAFLEPGTPDAEIIEAALSSAQLKNAQAVLALRLHLTNPNEDVRMTAYLALEQLTGASEEDQPAPKAAPKPIWVKDSPYITIAGKKMVSVADRMSFRRQGT